jgi:xylono-1,5-lactonase
LEDRHASTEHQGNMLVALMDWEVVAHGYGLAEAPTVDIDGSVVFSDVLGGGIYRIDTAGKVTTVVPKRRGVGGIAVHADGGIVCSGRDLVHVREDHEPRIVLHVDGVAGWNDLCTDVAGRVYAGALRFAVFDPAAEVVAGDLWRVSLDGDRSVVFGDVVHANGVACTGDGRTIYLSDTRRQRIIVFDNERGTRRYIDVSTLGHPDGMALDEQGAIWVALVSGGIARLTPDGEVDRTLAPPSAFTTSLCFAGRDLYVTTGGHSQEPELRGCVLRTTVDVAGAPVAPARV